jgi:glycosyltransferase involved in cell wall biosynthesis
VAPADLAVRVAIAQDWMTSYAGSERVVDQMLAVYPDARLLTTVLRPSALPTSLQAAEPSALQRFSVAREHHEWFLPLMPLLWASRTPIRDVDVVVSSSHACAKAVRHACHIPHVCYCHTPMRYAWDFASEAFRFPAAIRPAARVLMGGFRRWDRRTAQRVTIFLANSSAVARRIGEYYGRSAEIVFPPVRTDFFTPGGERSDYYLFVGRLTGYKRPDLVVEAFAELPFRLVVVGDGQMAPQLRARATANVEFLAGVDDKRLRELYRGARALIHPAEEDFGIAMAEAQACGTPVIAFARGGAADIVVDEGDGVLLDRQEAPQLRAAVRATHTRQFDAGEIAARAARFSTARFRRHFSDAVRSVVASALPDGRRTA